MGKSKLHKLIGKYNNGFYDYPILLQKYFDRMNYDVSEFKELRLIKKEKIADKEMKIEIIEYKQQKAF